MTICIDYRIWLYIKYRMCFATVINNKKLTKADVDIEHAGYYFHLLVYYQVIGNLLLTNN